MMQWSNRYQLWPFAMVFNKLNAVCCNCIIGRGAEFGPGFVLIHSTGVVVNGNDITPMLFGQVKRGGRMRNRLI